MKKKQTNRTAYLNYTQNVRKIVFGLINGTCAIKSKYTDRSNNSKQMNLYKHHTK